MKTSSTSVGRRWTVYYTPQSLSLIYSIEIPLKLNVDGAEYNSHDNDYKGGRCEYISSSFKHYEFRRIQLG